MPRPALFAALAACLLTAAPALAKPPRFKLDDQFERPHTARSLLKPGLVLILVGGDQRKTDAAIKRWIGPLKRALGHRATIVGYADLRDVPFFIPNSAIRSSMRKDLPRTPVLCDYKGRAAARLGFSRKTLIQVRVFDAKGRALGGLKGAYSAARLKRVRAMVERPK